MQPKSTPMDLITWPVAYGLQAEAGGGLQHSRQPQSHAPARVGRSEAQALVCEPCSRQAGPSLSVPRQPDRSANTTASTA